MAASLKVSAVQWSEMIWLVSDLVVRHSPSSKDVSREHF
jgi:hypothetical protein